MKIGRVNLHFHCFHEMAKEYKLHSPFPAVKNDFKYHVLCCKCGKFTKIDSNDWIQVHRIHFTEDHLY